MPTECFMVPLVGTGTTREDPFRPKYVDDPSVVSYGQIRSDKRDECVLILDATQTYLDSIAAQADTMRIATAANINTSMTTQQANNAKAFLESRNIPGEFINTGETRRQAIRGLCGMFLFCQRCEGKFGFGFKKRAVETYGVTLATIYSDFPQGLKDEFVFLAADHGWGVPPLGLTPANTLREILVTVADAFQNIPMFIGGFEV